MDECLYPPQYFLDDRYAVEMQSWMWKTLMVNTALFAQVYIVPNVHSCFFSMCVGMILKKYLRDSPTAWTKPGN